jgi:hypothetical protein
MPSLCHQKQLSYHYLQVRKDHHDVNSRRCLLSHLRALVLSYHSFERSNGRLFLIRPHFYIFTDPPVFADRYVTIEDPTTTILQPIT